MTSACSLILAHEIVTPLPKHQRRLDECFVSGDFGDLINIGYFTHLHRTFFGYCDSSDAKINKGQSMWRECVQRPLNYINRGPDHSVFPLHHDSVFMTLATNHKLYGTSKHFSWAPSPSNSVRLACGSGEWRNSGSEFLDSHLPSIISNHVSTNVRCASSTANSLNHFVDLQDFVFILPRLSLRNASRFTRKTHYRLLPPPLYSRQQPRFGVFHHLECPYCYHNNSPACHSPAHDFAINCA